MSRGTPERLYPFGSLLQQRITRSHVMKKLQLNRETVRNLTNTELGDVLGGNGIIQVTRACPVMTNGCTGGPCVVTLHPGTSIINPSGG